MIDELSIIIVTWKGDGLLKDCLESLSRVYSARPEIVVVDNANQDSTKEIVEGYENAKYVAAQSNLGFAGGNNLGLRHCTRPFILLLNNDTVVHDDSFSPLLEFLKKSPRVGIVQGTLNIPSLNNGLCGMVMMPWGIQKHLHRGEPTTTTSLVPRRVTAAKGAMLLFRREVVEQTGFLFYDHFKSYFEETDFCRRASNCGWETWFVPTPPVDHVCGATSGRFSTDEIWAQYFRNIIYSFSRNWGLYGKVMLLPAFCCAALIRSPRNLFCAFRMR